MHIDIHIYCYLHVYILYQFQYIGCTLISPTVKRYGSLSLICQFLAQLIFTFHDCIIEEDISQGIIKVLLLMAEISHHLGFIKPC